MMRVHLHTLCEERNVREPIDFLVVAGAALVNFDIKLGTYSVTLHVRLLRHAWRPVPHIVIAT